MNSAFVISNSTEKSPEFGGYVPGLVVNGRIEPKFIDDINAFLIAARDTDHIAPVDFADLPDHGADCS